MSTSVPLSPDTNGNPLVDLAVAVIYAILYVLQCVKALAAWATITVPRQAASVPSYRI